VAVDAHLPFVEEVRRRAVAAGVADRVEAVVGDMAELGELAGLGPFDAVWCEGAAYVLGFQEALEQWRPLLRPGGVMALTEPVWLAPTVRQAVSDFWTQAYPGMQPVQVRRAQILGAGYKRIGDFTLPREDWEAYYDPLRARLHDLGDDPSVAGVVADHERELAVFDGGGADTVGYQFFVMRPG
jgi:SAM-dependent methyltransferase